MWDATWANWSLSASLLASQSTTHSVLQAVGQAGTERGRTQLSEQASIIQHHLLIHPVGFFLFGMGSSVNTHEHTKIQPHIQTRDKCTPSHTHRCNTFKNRTHTLPPPWAQIDSQGGSGTFFMFPIYLFFILWCSDIGEYPPSFCWVLLLCCCVVSNYREWQ